MATLIHPFKMRIPRINMKNLPEVLGARVSCAIHDLLRRQ